LCRAGCDSMFFWAGFMTLWARRRVCEDVRIVGEIFVLLLHDVISLWGSFREIRQSSLWEGFRSRFVWGSIFWCFRSILKSPLLEINASSVGFSSWDFFVILR